MKNLIKKLDKNLKIIKSENIDDIMTIYVTRTNKSAVCPCCGEKTSSINSKYYRTIKDLPIQENKVIIKLEAKTFFCNNKNCHIKTFAETFDFIEKCSRMTVRLKDRIVENSKGMSARASKSVINESLANISDDTILRLVKKNSQKNKIRTR